MYKFFKDHHFLLDFLFADSIDRWPVNASSCKHELRLPAYRTKKGAVHQVYSA
jgi:hypothetical protein